MKHLPTFRALLWLTVRKRYRIQLLGNPSTDLALQKKYKAAFGSACYVSAANTFDCFYKKWEDARVDAVKIGEVSITSLLFRNLTQRSEKSRRR